MRAPPVAILLMDGYIRKERAVSRGHNVHGGGWEAGDKVTYVSPILSPWHGLRSAGFPSDYRLTPYVRVPDQLEDVRRQFALYASMPSVPLDPSACPDWRIGQRTLGGSGGFGTCPDCEAQAVVSFYGVYDLLTGGTDKNGSDRCLRAFLGDVPPETAARYSPI